MKLILQLGEWGRMVNLRWNLAMRYQWLCYWKKNISLERNLKPSWTLITLQQQKPAWRWELSNDYYCEEIVEKAKDYCWITLFAGKAGVYFQIYLVCYDDAKDCEQAIECYKEQKIRQCIQSGLRVPSCKYGKK